MKYITHYLFNSMIQFAQARKLVVVGRAVDWRECSKSFQDAYRRYCAAKRNISKIEGEIRHFCALKGLQPDSFRSSSRTPSPKVVKADLSDAKWDLVGPRVKSPFMGDFSWAPFAKIPNVRSFKVITSSMDKVFDYFGIKKRISPTMEYSLYENQSAIRYAKFTITRLRNVKSDRLYWKMVHVIMSRSIVFTLMAVSKSFERWHRELPLHLVMSWIFGSMKLSKEYSDEIKYKRIYIPKPNGKLRPLGVPTPLWRVHMTLVNWFLITRFDRLLPDWQHGFRPGRGVKTAWQVVLTKVIKARYIYEFDLKGFFDNVNVSKVVGWLKENSLTEGSSGPPARPDLSKIAPESRERAWRDWCGPRVMIELMELWAGTKAEWSDESLETYSKENPSDRLWGVVNRRGVKRTILPAPRGFPQGANVSPFLSICLLNLLNGPNFGNILMYADDGLIYSDKKFDERLVWGLFEGIGIEISQEKSGWVRENWKWNKPLKFLGMEFDGPSGRLSSSTRKGAQLEYDKSGLVKACAVSYLFQVPEDLRERHPFAEYYLWGPDSYEVFYTLKEARAKRAWYESQGVSSYMKIGRVTIDGIVLTDDIDSQNTWESVARSSIFGLLMSRMQSDSWNTEVDQDFRLSYVGKSWLNRRGHGFAAKHGLSMTFANTTSFAFHDVSSIVRKSRSNVLWKGQYKSGRIDLSELNRRRRTLGFSPIGPTYMKRFQIAR